MENKLHVENLTISFHTVDGKLQAVRGIHFDLLKGETLAIVGESGSGKSVTSKAILGILAGNAIVEDGEIIYDGRDLLKISEEDFHKIRGDKIAMIFQDPMSSLNPIVKIGRQLTEAMLLKGRARQKENRKNFNTYLSHLEKAMIASDTSGHAGDMAAKCKKFDTFEYKHLELEAAYNKAHDAADEAASELTDLIFELEKNAAKDLNYRLKRVFRLTLESVQEYVVKDKADALRSLVQEARAMVAAVKMGGESTALREKLTGIQTILSEALDLPMPNFFAMGYYVAYSGKEIPQMPVDELNKFLRTYLDNEFMLDFISNAKRALIYSADTSCREMMEAVEVLKAHRPTFEKESLNRKACFAALKVMNKEVMETVDPLDIRKDSVTYTFGAGLENTLNKYFGGISKNKKEKARFAKETAKHDAMVAKGKDPDWKVVAPALTDLDACRRSMLRQIDQVIEHYSQALERRNARNFDADTVAVIDYLKSCASGVVHKVTKRMAKEKAIKLMKEVGISEPRKRYNQYPFEFSGGMRQRIVIAIALAADPDILICDEPTTALDVTIQSQILELINDLKEKRHLSVIFITHDLGVVANMADRIAVMYAGKIVEYGTAADVFYHSAHPYTWALLSSMPDLDTNEKLDAIPGTPPNMIYPPVGDAFAARNKYAMRIDFERQPPMFRISDTHYAATWLLHPDAPHMDPPKAVTDRIARMQQKKADMNAQQEPQAKTRETSQESVQGKPQASPEKGGDTHGDA